MPTLGPKVYERDLCLATWSPSIFELAVEAAEVEVQHRLLPARFWRLPAAERLISSLFFRKDKMALKVFMVPLPS